MKEILIICAMKKESKTIAQELKLQKVTETVFKKNNISLYCSHNICKHKNRAILKLNL